MLTICTTAGMKNDSFEQCYQIKKSGHIEHVSNKIGQMLNMVIHD